MNELVLYQRETKTYRYTVTTAAGDVVDLTGGVAHWVAKRLRDGVVVIAKTGTILAQAGATKGQFDVTLIPTDSESLTPDLYTYDVWFDAVDTTRHSVVPPSILRILDAVGPDDIPTPPSSIVDDGYRYTLEAGNMQDGIPEDKTIRVAIKGRVNVQLGVQPDHGNDLSPTKGQFTDLNAEPVGALETADHAMALFGQRAMHGLELEFYLLGGGANGFLAPTDERSYQVFDILLRGGAAFRPNVSWWGPHAMLPQTGLGDLTCTAITNVGPSGPGSYTNGPLSTKWTFAEDIGSLSGRGTVFLRVLDKATGVEVTAPIQIACQLDTHNILSDNGPNAGGGIFVADGTQRYQICGAAAQIVNRGPGASLDGVLLQGFGAFEVGGMQGDVNPRANFTRLAFERLRLAAIGQLSFATCYGYGGGRAALIARGGNVRWSGCRFDGDVELMCGGRRVPEGTSSAVNEFKVWARDNQGAPFPSGDPQFPHRGPIELLVRGKVRVGMEEENGRLYLPQALSVRAPAGSVAITVRGNGSAVIQSSGGLVYILPDDDVTALLLALDVQDGAQGVVNDSTDGGYVITKATTHLRCGTLTAQLGTGAGGLRQVGGFAGNMFQNGTRIRDVGTV